ncbi:hypothetical protein AJ80_10079, partial [Polytolypa hystricis UAMH7299]
AKDKRPLTGAALLSSQKKRAKTAAAPAPISASPENRAPSHHQLPSRPSHSPCTAAHCPQASEEHPLSAPEMPSTNSDTPLASNVDPRIIAAVEKIYAEDPAYHEPETPELTTTKQEEGTCAICHYAWFLPMQFGPCGHVFCAKCLWIRLCSQPSDNSPCKLCNSLNYDFRYQAGMETNSTNRSDLDRGKICLIILFMKLQHLEGASFDLDIESEDYKAFKMDGDSDAEGVQGIDTEILDELWSEERLWAARSMMEEAPEEEEDSEEEQLGLLGMLLQRIPVDALKGNLGGMRFARIVMQRRLETLAPNYRMW